MLKKQLKNKNKQNKDSFAPHPPKKEISHVLTLKNIL